MLNVSSMTSDLTLIKAAGLLTINMEMRAEVDI